MKKLLTVVDQTHKQEPTKVYACGVGGPPAGGEVMTDYTNRLYISPNDGRWNDTTKGRLLALASWLEANRLGHAKFDFSTINKGSSDGESCGTLGCAMGEMPILWPSDWKFFRLGSTTSIVLPINSDRNDWWDWKTNMSRWFGIRVGALNGLFFPYNYRPWANGYLDNNATAAEVAQNIRDFVKWHDSQLGLAS